MSSNHLEWTDARVIHIYVSSGHDYWGKQGEGRMQHGIQEVSEIECVRDKGLKGDRYFGYRPNFKGQVTFFDMAVVDEVRESFKLKRLPASVFRRNVIVEGMDLRACLGNRFFLQGIEFEGSQECKPCHWMDRAIAPGVQDYLAKQFRGGLRAKVLSTGNLHRNG
ncbi:molybdenum cofactor biosysynthesis protein [Phragmitibacter flavus]|uniref:Molybdenum cofactor biosysynthesis protein n=1 Tax=Phragmitibacter flavus TaxID=2576071 RepID=A0A5R8KHQ0_9BACT|nr:molybdenum cofactor biosysynthesis protein [Phragmitibacter flavus]